MPVTHDTGSIFSVTLTSNTGDCTCLQHCTDRCCMTHVPGDCQKQAVKINFSIIDFPRRNEVA